MNRNRGPSVPWKGQIEPATNRELQLRTMAWKRDAAKGYRDRAQELRTKAHLFSVENHDMLLQLADLYDRFADEVEAGRWDGIGPH